MYKFILLIMVSLIVSCENSPHIVIQGTLEQSIVTGTISSTIEGVKLVIADATPIDTVVTSSSGFFAFPNIPYGNYEIYILSDEYYASGIFVNINKKSQDIGRITVYRRKDLIVALFPEDSAVIEYSYYKMNSGYFSNENISLYIETDSSIDTSEFLSSYTLITETQDTLISKYVTISQNSSFGKYRYRIYYPIDSVFSYSILNFTVDTLIGKINGIDKKFSLNFTIFPDLTILNQIKTDEHIFSTVPSDSQVNVSPRSEVKIVFEELMDESSVESAISLIPKHDLNYSWNGRRLTITFGTPLKNSTEYTLIIDTIAETALGEKFLTNYSTLFFTQKADISYYSPLNGTKQFGRDSIISISVNFEIDSVSFYNNFQITPVIDSLYFEYKNNYSDVFIHHSTLDTGTNYTLTILSTLQSVSGDTLGDDFVLNFKSAR